MTESDVLRVKLLRDGARLPWRATAGATGFDLFACLPAGESLALGPDVALVPTGIALETPPGFDVQIRPRSGLSRQGVTVELGTIDADYRGEIFVSMRTFGTLATYRVEHGDRIAQLVVGRTAEVAIIAAEELSPSARADAGHGSTGR